MRALDSGEEEIGETIMLLHLGGVIWMPRSERASMYCHSNGRTI